MMEAMDNFLLSKEKSQAALTIGEAKPALSGRSEGEGARPTHYYWSFHGQETNSFGKGRHERGNRRVTERARYDQRLHGWPANSSHGAHTDTPESSESESGAFGAFGSAEIWRGNLEGVNAASTRRCRVNWFASATNWASEAKNGSACLFQAPSRLSFFFNRALCLDIYIPFGKSLNA